MNNPRNDQKQMGQSMNQQGSGSRYHEEHAGKVTGYGQPDPIAEEAINKNDSSASS